MNVEKGNDKGRHDKKKNLDAQKGLISAMHKEIASGTLKSILEQANIELDEFLKFL